MFMESYRVIDQERLLDELDPMAHELGVEVGEHIFNTAMDVHEICYRLSGVRAEHERLTEPLDRVLKSWEECCRLFERLQRRKRRKTTYKTIRRDCAKRNRHK